MKHVFFLICASPFLGACYYDEQTNALTFLQRAVITEDLETITRFSKQKEIINMPDEEGYTPLHYALISALVHQRYTTIELLLQYGANPTLQFYQVPRPFWFTDAENAQNFFRLRTLPLSMKKLFIKNPTLDDQTLCKIQELLRQKIQPEVSSAVSPAYFSASNADTSIN